MKKFAIGADHAGFEMKEFLKNWLRQQGFETKDFGTHSSDAVDYPDFAHPVAKAVASESFSTGLLLCGSANGVAMAANKHSGIRAAIAWNPEISALARQHNNANILCIPSRYVNNREAEEILKSFIEAEFEGGRHERRANKISMNSRESQSQSSGSA